MKEVKHYICEICGTEYNDKAKAQGCEKGHKKPIEIIKASYISISNVIIKDSEAGDSDARSNR